MRRGIFIILLVFVGFSLFGQEKAIISIDDEVRSIEANEALNKKAFDWAELQGISTDGGGILEVWWKGSQIYKVKEEVGLSFGSVTKTIYLKTGKPIKIIETEENFEQTSNGFNYEDLKEVYKEIVYVFDWENYTWKNPKLSKKQIGKRKFSEDGGCKWYDGIKETLVLAKKAITK